MIATINSICLSNRGKRDSQIRRKKIMKNTRIENILGVIEKKAAKAAPALAIGVMALSTAGAFASPSIDINNTLETIMTIIYGFLYFAGAINIIMGIVNVAGAMSEEGGQDAQQLQKGKGRIVRGAIMVAAPSVLLLIGISPGSFTIG